MPKLDTPKATRELGPGKGGASDFIAVRLNSMALIVLSAWFLTALLLLPDLSYPVVTRWLAHPLNALMMIAFIAVTCWHSKYGFQEVIDDYVHSPVGRAIAISAMYVFTTGAAAFGIWSVARIALTPA